MKFDEFNLNEKTLQALAAINYDEATVIQEKVIPVILDGKDIVARSETGSGKTLAFGLPIIQNIEIDKKFIQALIVCPTRELAAQVTDELRKITGFIEGARVVPIFGGSDMVRQIKLIKSGAKIIVGTPGRLIDHINRKTLKLDKLKFLVLDEADEMLNMGFKDDIENIIKVTNPQRQTLMFSATFPPAIKAITSNYQNNAITIEVGEANKSLNNISQKYVFVERNQKQAALLEIYEICKPNLSIVFCNTKAMVEDVKALLSKNKYKVAALHGDMRQSERRRVMQSFKNGECNILVATDVAARGIDINNIDYVINYDLPNDQEYFLHRIGRTARAGKQGNAITIINNKKLLGLLKDYERQTKSNIEELKLSNTLSNVEEKTADNKKLSNRRNNAYRGNRNDSNRYNKSERGGENRGARNSFKKDDNFMPKKTFKPKKSFKLGINNTSSLETNEKPSVNSDKKPNFNKITKQTRFQRKSFGGK